MVRFLVKVQALEAAQAHQALMQHLLDLVTQEPPLDLGWVAPIQEQEGPHPSDNLCHLPEHPLAAKTGLLALDNPGQAVLDLDTLAVASDQVPVGLPLVSPGGQTAVAVVPVAAGCQVLLA